MIEEDQPNPDEILKNIQKQEKETKLGKLKIFFGMSAGVGKTFTMLQEAQQRLKEGVNLVIGTINTHGRKETEALLQGLPIIPEKWVKYKDTVFEELDIETIIDRKPELVLVDELAHTNMPGSKHPKRWQDVIEILDAGIDVYTTLNVQHVESRKDIIESLTGIQVRETVPDLILERATSMELVDIPPPELLKRLREGKIYLGNQSRVAAENFFKEENLMALREIALRFTAEKVDHDLHERMHGKGWKTRERLMVAISSSPTSEQLIRATRRLAFELDAPWITVYVDTGIKLNDLDQTRLNKHLTLARDLGAEVVTIQDLSVAAALQRIAKQRDITRIIIGRPPKKFSPWNFFRSSFIDRLEKETKHIDLVILRQEIPNYQNSIPQYQLTSPWSAYALVLIFNILVSIFGLIVGPYIGYKSVGFIFLLGILILSFFVGSGPIFFAALLSALCWELIFIPPLFNPAISNPNEISMVVIYFFSAAIMGVMTSRMRVQDQLLHKREENIERLYEIQRDIANANNLQYLRLNVCSRLEHIFSGKFEILNRSLDNQLIIDSHIALLKEEKERATAEWVFRNGKVGGWSTDTLPSAEGIYFPIKFSKSTVGVLIYFPANRPSLSLEEMNFIQTVAQQLSIYIERYLFEEKVNRQDYTRQIERTHQSIFHSLNRSFYEPLEEILHINHRLKQSPLDPSTRSLVTRLEQFIFNIKFKIDNMIGISELESGFVHFNRKQYPIKEVIDKSISETQHFANIHLIEIKVPQGIFLPFDFDLLKLALNNLILNAIEYSPPATLILLNVEVFKNTFEISISDQGPGIPEEIFHFIFEKFHRLSPTSKGLGLGLAIVKAVVDIHHGTIEVKNRQEGGTIFSLILPI